MFSVFYDDGHRGIEIKSTGQRWFLEHDYEVQAFVRWLNQHAAQPTLAVDGLTEEQKMVNALNDNVAALEEAGAFVTTKA